jgi:hypothetical protein
MHGSQGHIAEPKTHYRNQHKITSTYTKFILQKQQKEEEKEKRQKRSSTRRRKNHQQQVQPFTAEFFFGEVGGFEIVGVGECVGAAAAAAPA